MKRPSLHQLKTKNIVPDEDVADEEKKKKRTGKKGRLKLQTKMLCPMMLLVLRAIPIASQRSQCP